MSGLFFSTGNLDNLDLSSFTYNNCKDLGGMFFGDYINSLVADKKDYYLLLDEVQKLENFAETLNGFLRYDNLDVYVTGSNSRFLSTDVLTEFSGRGDEIHVFPLSFSEFCSAYTGPQAKAWQEYLLYGGLPLVLSQSSETAKTGYLKKLFEETYFVDVTKRHHLKKNPEELEELMQILASAVGSLTNTLKLANTFHSEKHIRISRVTLNTYCRYFQEAFLLHKAKRYDINSWQLLRLTSSGIRSFPFRVL